MAWEQRREHKIGKAHETIIANNNNNKIVHDQLWLLISGKSLIQFTSFKKVYMKWHILKWLLIKILC